MRVLLYCEMLLTFDTRHFNEFHLHKIIITRNVLIAICIGGVPTRLLCLRTRRDYQTELEMESVSRAEGARAARSNATARLTKTKKSQKRRQRRRRRKHSVDSDIDAAARTTRHSKCHSAVPQQVALYGMVVEIGVTVFRKIFPAYVCVCGLPLSGFHAATSAPHDG